MTHGKVDTHGPTHEVLQMAPEAAAETTESQDEALEQSNSHTDDLGGDAVRGRAQVRRGGNEVERVVVVLVERDCILS